MSTPTELRGPELMRAVVNQILAHPETWNQHTWHCGTRHCFGGWCQILGGRTPNALSARKDAKELLGLGDEADALLYCNTTLEQIYLYAKQFVSGEELEMTPL